MRGRLIYILGIDGSGKTTLAEKLYNHFNKKEPDSCKLALGYNMFTNELEVAAKKAHTTRRECFSAQMRGVIWGLDLLKKAVDILIPVMDKGKDVIVDRYDICNKVYTYINCGNVEMINLIHQLLPRPDIYIFLDVDCKIAYKRILSRGKEISPTESLDKLYQASELYEYFIKENDLPIVRISGNGKQDDVLEECIHKIAI